jgi:hypothetical protein
VIEILSQLLRLSNSVNAVADAARHRASPNPIISVRGVVYLSAVVAVGALAYITWFDSLAAAPSIRVALGVILVAVGTVTALLIGNHVDAAATRRRIARRDFQRLVRRSRGNFDE